VELVTELDNLTSALKVGDGALEQAVEEKIDNLLARVPPVKREAWQDRADVACALGLTWGEARRWSEAIQWLEKALHGTKGDCPIRAVEQCANYRVRKAAEDWVCAQLETEQALEPKRQDLIGIIESATLEMDLISQRAVTEERLNLLGSAFKRLAQIQNHPGSRKKALMNMENYFRQALELSGGEKPYPFTSWATARLLIGDGDKRLGAIDYTRLHGDADRLEQALIKRNERDPNFWDSASIADIDLVRLLARCGSDKDNPQACQALAERIASTYQQAIQRGASPREKGSVMENIEFLLALTEQRLPLNQLIRQIMGALK
jgi:tetratricopeptide (TPR) repeat protein